MSEGLSRSTTWTDLNERFDGYDATPTIRHCVLVFQDQARATTCIRNKEGDPGRNRATVLRGPGDALSLDGPGISLPLSLIREGVEPDA